MNSFIETLKRSSPEPHFSPALKSLWYDAKGNWERAHAEVDHLTDLDAAWVHAYLHRKEGDQWNADYWYAKARKRKPDCSLEEEWESLVSYFLER
jgi:hypothetical protein